MSDKAIVMNAGKLTDMHMSFCQTVLKVQFPMADGLECTLFQSKQRETKIESVVHMKGRDHWILASNTGHNTSLSTIQYLHYSRLCTFV